ncbi:hypothetical protein PFLUV_G00265230 [Perca fluviatilis]|uniref:Uncharacterized protein n=1 Tax=Perca fluviatilis TaxID=8168 RepID=A0A6A5E940_PERFL|nr:hypothetical protein PFLUV_G00265230 [Perca fluviatilis]
MLGLSQIGIASTHTHCRGGRNQEPGCIRRFEPLPEDRQRLRLNPHSVDSDFVTPLTALIVSLNLDRRFSS